MLKMSAAVIHHELYAVYGQNVMSKGTVRQWCRMFRDGQTKSDDLVQNVDQKICER
jgi:hypothetical protein